MPSEMGDISDLELPMLLENDGNLEKAEACRKELEDVSESVKHFTIKERSNVLLSLSGML
jgi:hypothetical protein